MYNIYTKGNYFFFRKQGEETQDFERVNITIHLVDTGEYKISNKGVLINDSKSMKLSEILKEDDTSYGTALDFENWYTVNTGSVADAGSGGGGGGTAGGSLETTSQQIRTSNQNQETLLTDNNTKLDELKTAITNQNTSIDRAFGVDSSNNSVIVRVLETRNGVKQPLVYENLDGTVYDLTATGGAFQLDSNSTETYAFSSSLFRAKANNIVPGYSVDDIIEKNEVVDLVNNTVISVRYRNITTATNLVSNDVVEAELSTNPNIPQTLFTEKYLIVDTEATNEVIKGLVYKTYRDDNTFNWVDVSGNVVTTPITVTQELVRSDLEIEAVIPTTTYPLVIAANTLKHLEIGVISGSYTISINNGNPNSIPVGYLRDFDSRDNVDSWVNDKIEINQITAGQIVIRGKKPETLRNKLLNRAAAINDNSFVNANSNFIIHTNDSSLFTVDGAGDITSIAVPPNTGSTDTFTPAANNNFKYVQMPTGAKAFQAASSTALTIFNFSGIVNNSNETRIVSFTKDLTVNSLIARFSSYNQSLVFRDGNVLANLDFGQNFVTVPRSSLNLTTAEENGTAPLIISFDRELSAGNQTSTLTLYSENNPNGFVVGSSVRTATTDTASQTFGTVSAAIHSVHAVDLADKANFINIAKQQALITW